MLPDGRFITLLAADKVMNGGTESEMRTALNWFNELKRLMPTKSPAKLPERVAAPSGFAEVPRQGTRPAEPGLPTPRSSL